MLDEKLINELLSEAKEKFARQAEEYKQKANRIKLYQKLMNELVKKPYHEEVQDAIKKGEEVTDKLRSELWVKYKPIASLLRTWEGYSPSRIRANSVLPC